ncbi:MAG: NAD(P)/FAD-dependent oxidoreductase [Tannerella sp.]|jgi:phytoene dehydrogenase-like protein|nr:NAD(P)/FAD-dependent oxidoreductase [Tannerella sp.]
MCGKKKIAIIGGGISGLSAGVYACLQGLDAELYESHHSVGGECTTWHREGYEIDGCIHWMTGTKPGTSWRELWETCGALSAETGVVNHERITSSMDGQGGIYHLYSDIKKMEDELLRISPDDRKAIKELIRRVKIFQKVKPPIVKPMDMLSVWEKLKFFLPYTFVVRDLLAGMKISVADYVQRFRSPVIRRLLLSVSTDRRHVNTLFLAIACRTNGDGGWPLGGSLRMAQRMQQRFETLGGKVFLNSKVEKIVVERGRATGIRVQGETSVRPFDFIVPAMDIHALLNQLLEGNYSLPYYEKRFADIEKYPLISSMQIAFSVKTDLRHRPHSMTLEPSRPLIVGGERINHVHVRHYTYDPAFSSDGNTLTVIWFANFAFDRWEALKEKSEQEYQSEKKRIGDLMLAELQRVYPETDGKAHVIDVATPLAYHKFCNAYKGAYMSFLSRPGTMPENHRGVIDGIDNLFLAGQWVFPDGGLPLALLSGKFAIQRLAKREGRKG